MAKKKPKSDPQPATEPIAPPPLRLEYRSPAELAENSRNWRTHPPEQIAALTEVMADVGWAGACLYNERTGVLIDGHARRKLALEQGAPLVPVLIGSWTEEQERKILLSLDPIAEMAVAGQAALKAMMEGASFASDALTELLKAKIDIDVSPQDDPLPDIEETTKFSFLVTYFADDLAAIKMFLGLGELPKNQIGRLVLERIKASVTNRADQE